MFQMKKLVYLLLFFVSVFGFAQTDSLQIKISGKIVDQKTNDAISGVTILNKNTLVSALATEKGQFEIFAKVNDKLLFSHLGYNYAEVEITEKWLSDGKIISLSEKITEIETVVVYRYPLTGYLEVDTKLIAINENYRYNIKGLNLGYEPGMKAKNAAENLLKSLTNPVDLVYNLFNSKEKDLKKILDLKNDTHFKELLSKTSDRESLVMLLQLNKIEIEKILEKCNYSKVFIDTASDLQVLDALATSYNDYKVIKKN